jgi:chromatin remodeling complex protein RSC6
LTCIAGFGIFTSPAARRREKIRVENQDRIVQRRIEMAKKKAKKSGKKRKPNAAFMKAMTPSSTLAAVIGSSAMPRTEVTKKIWGYIKRNGLQDKKNRRMINSDEKLKSVFGGKSQVSMFEMTKLVSKHLK